jgi:hypothetical protein
MRRSSVRRKLPGKYLIRNAGVSRQIRVILAAAHLDHDPGNNRQRNLNSLCQRCGVIHDRTARRCASRVRVASGLPRGKTELEVDATTLYRLVVWLDQRFPGWRSRSRTA